VTVEITPRAVGQIKSGSLWIFANEFVTKMAALTPGAWVNFSSKGKFVGYGYVNPKSLIAGRICSLAEVKEGTGTPNRKSLIKNLLQRANQKRPEELRNSGSYRAVFSESDFLPGLIIDVYEKTVVAQLNTKGMDDAKVDIVSAIEEVLNPDNIVIRADSSIRTLEGAPIFTEVAKGNESELKVSKVREGNISFVADFINGQKTGFFLDQRENRQHLMGNSAGKTVLDLCSYSGGWGLSALKGGAKNVTFVDQSKEALDLVSKGLELNKFDKSSAALAACDVFDFLKSESKTFDIVVCDPPAFVKSKKNLDQAIRGYKKLNLQAAAKVKSGGLFYTCSCSFHLSEADFELLLRQVFQDMGRQAQVVYRGEQPLDHPWIINRPESRYLKCYCFRLE
jgi:23S rRNA (cytosine1962-C5)-methyltransferase